MAKKPNDDPTLQEIFSHIEQLLVSKTESKPSIKNIDLPALNPIEISMTSISIEKQLLSPLIEHTDDNSSPIPLTNQTNTEISTMKHYSTVPWNDDSFGVCDLCHQDIQLGKNLSGLVVENQYFACEECCRNTPNEELKNWTKSRMHTSNSMRPIGLWLTREKTKNTTVLFRK
ncbi:MAG: hypothetical protein NT038_06165 [Euryarchaeota archaeon]|nr:hypothetical protein [Euryarchaeota archaeon]